MKGSADETWPTPCLCPNGDACTATHGKEKPNGALKTPCLTAGNTWRFVEMSQYGRVDECAGC